MKYKRILLKLSGEALMGSMGYGLDPQVVREIASQIVEIQKLGVEIGIVVGGGNIFRGINADNQGIDRVTGDYIGMIATAINALALQSVLESMGSRVRVLSALKLEKIAEPFVNRKAVSHLGKGNIVIFACGTGNPYFSTDTAAAMRAIETGADVLIKATKVNGVFDRDPEKDPDAVFYKSMTYKEVIDRDLKVMDMTAITLCRDGNLPIIVFNIREKGNLMKAVQGGEPGTIVRREA